MANLKNTTIDGTVFRLPAGDTAARPTGTNGAQLRFNTDTGQLEQFRPGLGAWIAPNNTGVIATGGDAVYDVETEGTTYRVHVFTATGTSTFSVLQGGKAEYLIVGGGGAAAGGGGGAGGVVAGTIDLSKQNYLISVGAGGTSTGNFNDNQPNGDNSTAFGLTALGGGAGGNNGGVGQDGGSGGGDGYNTGGSNGGGSALQPSQSNQDASVNAGNSGGNAPNCSGPDPSGGGGGAGGPGENCPTCTSPGGDGGIGLSFIITGTFLFYGGGGAGGDPSGGSRGLGGLGGGGNGGDGSNTATEGTPNTGGGGGGGENPVQSGGSGIVVIRYPLRQNNPETAEGQDVGDGLVLDLDFAKPTVYNGSGIVVTDSRLNGIEGDLINGPAFVNSRTHRSAFEFDGSDDYINLPDFYTATYWERNGAWTVISAHIIENISATRGGIFNNQRFRTETNPGGFGVGLDSGSYDAQFTDAISGTSSGGAEIAVTYNEPEIITYTWNPSTSTLTAYRNGLQENQKINNNISWSTRTDGRNTRIFRNIQGGWQAGFIQGKLFAQQIFNRALSSDEVFEKYNFLKWRFGV